MDFMTVGFIIGGVIFVVGTIAMVVIVVRHGLPSGGWPELRAKYPCGTLCAEMAWSRFQTLQMNPAVVHGSQGSKGVCPYKGASDGTSYYFKKAGFGNSAERTVCIPITAVEIEELTGPPSGMLDAVIRSLSASDVPDVRLHVKDYEYPITVDGQTFKKIQEAAS